MAPIPLLFSLPIPPAKDSTGKLSTGGNVIVITPAKDVYLISFSSPPDNRLTPSFCCSLHLALLILRSNPQKYPKGPVILTSSISKFFSNGLDFASASTSPTFFQESIFPLWHTLLTYPMPVIALINGHAFAAGLMTAMFCDYRIMNPHKGFVCLNELDFGAHLRPQMAIIFKQKIPNPHTFRTMVLESKRFNALQALEGGIVDALGGLDETLKFIEEMKLVEKAKSTSYSTIKDGIYRESVLLLEGEPGIGKYEKERAEMLKKRFEEEHKKVGEWVEKEKAKL
jgi:Delta3-Delta2-enoyl-CoA isomerase